MKTFRLFSIRKMLSRSTERARIRELELTVLELIELNHNQNKILMQIAKTRPECEFKKIPAPVAAVYDHVDGNLAMMVWGGDEPDAKGMAEFINGNDDFVDDDDIEEFLNG